MIVDGFFEMSATESIRHAVKEHRTAMWTWWPLKSLPYRVNDLGAEPRVIIWKSRSVREREQRIIWFN
jgi:hypothetical protein